MTHPTPIGRRQFLRLAATATGGALLAACGAPETAGSPTVSASGASTDGTAAAPVAGAASGAATVAPGTTQLTFLNLLAGAQTEAGDALINGFNASQDRFTVTSLAVQPPSYESVLERLQALAVARQLPAITQAGYQYSTFMRTKLPITSLQTYIDRDSYDLSDFYPAMLRLGQAPDGTQEALPFAVSTPIVYRNDELFEKAGLDPAAPLDTWDQVRAAAEQLKTAGAEGVFYAYDVTGNWTVQAMIECAGGRMIADDGTTVTFNDEPGVRALSHWNDLVQAGLMPLLTGEQAFQSFAGGTLGMLVTSTAGLGGLRASAKFPLSTSLFPTDGTHERRVPAGGNNLFILGQTDAEREGAWKFIQYMTSSEATASVAQSIGYMATRKTAVDERLKDYLADNAAAAKTYEQLPNMVPWANFPGDVGTRAHKLVQENIQATFAKQKTPAQALSDAAAACQQLIGG